MSNGILKVVNVGTVPGIGITGAKVSTLTDVIAEVLMKVAPSVRKGSFILDGHAYEEKVTCILRCDLIDGTFTRNFHRRYDKRSDDLACESIDEMLNWLDSEKSCYSRFLHPGSKYIPSNYYRNGEHAVMVLNSQYGCMYFSCHLDDDTPDSYLDEDISYVVAYTLRSLLSDDAVLRESVDNLVVQIPSDRRLDEAIRLAQEILSRTKKSE